MRFLKVVFIILMVFALAGAGLSELGYLDTNGARPVQYHQEALAYVRWAFLFFVGAICAEWLQWAAKDREEIMKQQEEIRKLLWQIQHGKEDK